MVWYYTTKYFYIKSNIKECILLKYNLLSSTSDTCWTMHCFIELQDSICVMVNLCNQNIAKLQYQCSCTYPDCQTRTNIIGSNMNELLTKYAVCVLWRCVRKVVNTDRQYMYVLHVCTETWPREEMVQDTSVCPQSTHKFLLVLDYWGHT